MLAMKVMSVLYNRQEDRIEIVREITKDDGAIEYNGLSIPADKLEWLSATYEIDDINELSEIAVYESFLPPDDPSPDALTARQQRRLRMAAIKSQLGPMIPLETKQALKLRLAAAGIPPRYINAVDDDPMTVISQRSRMSDLTKKEKLAMVRAARRGQTFRRDPIHKDKLDEARAAARTHGKRQAALPSIKLIGGKRVREQTDV